MKVTNNSGLPLPIFEALSSDDYSRGDSDISVTQLIDSPRVRVLKSRHNDETSMEADSLLSSFLGKAFHRAVELGTKTGVSERRLSIRVRDWTISGGMDYYHEGHLLDYKTTNVFKASYSKKGHVDSFDKQLNVYAHILREHDYEVKSLSVFCLFLDWRRNEFSKAYREGKLWIPNIKTGYPERKWITYEIDLWEPEVAKAYIDDRVLKHQSAEVTIPLCTSEEIWRGSRCSQYCEVAPFCSQYQEAIKSGLMAEEASQ